jgi:hypothetical protein
LADAATARIDQSYVLQDRLMGAIAQAGSAADLLIERTLNLGPRYDRAVGLGSPVIGFDQHITNLIDEERELAGVVRNPRRAFQQQSDAIPVYRLEAFARDDRRDKCWTSFSHLFRGNQSRISALLMPGHNAPATYF